MKISDKHLCKGKRYQENMFNIKSMADITVNTKHKLATCIDKAFQTPGYGPTILEQVLAIDKYIAYIIYKESMEIGFGFGYLMPAGALSLEIGEALTLPNEVQTADHQGKIGILKTIAILPNQQRKGFGSKLVRLLANHLVKEGANQLVVPAWQAGQRINISGAMSRNGFTSFMHTALAWKTECDAKTFLCPERNESCQCNIVWYSKAST